MGSDDFSLLLQKLAAGWTSRDYESVAENFADDMFYSDPFSYTIRDRESLLRFFSDDEGKPQHCEFHNVVFDEKRQAGAAEYTYEGTYRYHGTVWIELREGKISSWREYQHRSDENWNTFWKR